MPCDNFVKKRWNLIQEHRKFATLLAKSLRNQAWPTEILRKIEVRGLRKHCESQRCKKGVADVINFLPGFVLSRLCEI
jgi:hypothetical protein